MASFQDTYKKLKEHLARAKNENVERMIGTENDFVAFMNRASLVNNKRNDMSEPDQVIHDTILNYMIENQSAAKDLKNELPDMYKEKKEYMNKLRADAEKHARADATKKEAAQIKARRKEAKKELERIRQERIKNAAREQGREATKEELAAPKLHEGKPTNWARRRNPLIGIANYMSLGSRSERRGLDEKGNMKPEFNYRSDVWQAKGAETIEHLSADEKIRLTGAKFEPDPSVKKNPEKVALVFSGSGGTGAEYIDSIKDTYLAQGITVVQLDYRGFGTSTNIDKKGNHVSNSPSERTMYEDGMEMYRYVNEKMGIKPENITLHGFSLGGAIASRVGLEVTKNIQNQRVMENKKPDPKKGLGGIVLHSPMKSLYHAAKTQSAAPFGFLTWAFGGGYNTEEHMLELSKIDKNIPVHMIGGNTEVQDSQPENENWTYSEVDWLSPEKTGLKSSLEGKFTNCTFTAGKGNHMGKSETLAKDKFGELIKDEEGYVQKIEKSESNVRMDDVELSNVLNLGREGLYNRHLEAQQENIEQQGPGI